MKETFACKEHEPSRQNCLFFPFLSQAPIADLFYLKSGTSFLRASCDRICARGEVRSRPTPRAFTFLGLVLHKQTVLAADPNSSIRCHRHRRYTGNNMRRSVKPSSREMGVSAHSLVPSREEPTRTEERRALYRSEEPRALPWLARRCSPARSAPFSGDDVGVDWSRRREDIHGIVVAVTAIHLVAVFPLGRVEATLRRYICRRSPTSEKTFFLT